MTWFWFFLVLVCLGGIGLTIGLVLEKRNDPFLSYFILGGIAVIVGVVGLSRVYH